MAVLMVPSNTYESEDCDWSKKQGHEKIQKDEGVSCCHKGIHGKDEEEKMISIKWVIPNKGTEEHPIAKGASSGTRVQHWRQTW